MIRPCYKLRPARPLLGRANSNPYMSPVEPTAPVAGSLLFHSHPHSLAAPALEMPRRLSEDHTPRSPSPENPGRNRDAMPGTVPSAAQFPALSENSTPPAPPARLFQLAES